MATLFVELYLSQVGASYVGDIFSSSLTVGWDFQSDASAVELINAVTSLDAVVSPPSINLALTQGDASYRMYFWPHRISDNFYNLGQTLETHIDAIAAAGYKSVISFRANGETTNRLSWENQTGPVLNGEFSDDNGLLNITAEFDAVTAAGMSFYNLPVTGALAYTKEQFDSFLPSLQAAAANGPVLVHCASGYRSVVYTLAFLALEDPQVRCVDWAIQQARRVGESLDLLPNDIAQAVGFWRETLAC